MGEVDFALILLIIIIVGLFGYYLPRVRTSVQTDADQE